MAKRTYDERIEELMRKQEQLKAQERQLKKLQNVEERKKRTKRLIEMGAIIESVLGRPVTDEYKERLRSFLRKQETNGSFFTKAMNVQT